MAKGVFILLLLGAAGYGVYCWYDSCRSEELAVAQLMEARYQLHMNSEKLTNELRSVQNALREAESKLAAAEERVRVAEEKASHAEEKASLADARILEIQKESENALAIARQNVEEANQKAQAAADKLKDIPQVAPTPVAKPEIPDADYMPRWVDFHKTTSSQNDLSYMDDHFEDVLTNLKTGEICTLDTYKQEELDYVSRWAARKFDVVDYKISGNIIEIRSRYTCTNAKGKTVKGYCKTTYRISDNGRIDGYADTSSVKELPSFTY